MTATNEETRNPWSPPLGIAADADPPYGDTGESLDEELHEAAVAEAAAEAPPDDPETDEASIDDGPSDSAQSTPVKHAMDTGYALGYADARADAEAEAEAEPAARPGAYDDPRRVVLDWYRKRVESQLQPVTDGTWEGVYVVTRADLLKVLQDVLPAASSHVAVVKTPAFVTFDAVCPRCFIAGEIVLEADSKLEVDSPSRAHLKLKVKATPRPHRCGQQRIQDVVPTPPGQQKLPIETFKFDVDEGEDDRDDVEREADEQGVTIEAAEAELEGDVSRETIEEAPRWIKVDTSEEGFGEPTAESDLDLGGCPYPGCPLAAEHPGDHAPAAAADEADLTDLPF